LESNKRESGFHLVHGFGLFRFYPVQSFYFFLLLFYQTFQLVEFFVVIRLL